MQYYTHHPLIPDSADFVVTAGVLDSFYIHGTLTGEDFLLLLTAGVITPQEETALKSMTAQDAHDWIHARMVQNWSGFFRARLWLSWHYDWLDNLTQFKIYRSIDSGVHQLYHTIDALPMTYHLLLDDDIDGDRQYTYSLYAEHADNGFSPMSTQESVDVPAF